MDRFALQFSLGYVAPEDEVAIMSAQEQAHPIDSIKPCVNVDDVMRLKEAVKAVRVSDELKRYIVDLVSATRTAAGVQLGSSPRGSLALMKASQALALFEDMEFVTPEHISEIASSVIAHRVSLDPQAKFSGSSAEGIVDEIMKAAPVPK